jgi:DNA-binding Lrp family transcriptional regulator
MRGEGKSLKEISEEMQISETTLSRRLAALHHEKGILSKYRQLQGLQLTGLQARILEEVDLKNLDDTPLLDLLNTFKILKKMEILIEGKTSPRYKMKGLVDHLLFMEKLEKYSAQRENNPTKL